MNPPDRLERLVRALLLLIASAFFTGVAMLAGVTKLTDKTLVFGCVALVVIGAALVSRFGSKWIMRRLPARK